MKGYTVCLIVAVLFVQSMIAEPETCPPYEEGEEDPPIDVLLPHESDCNKYYKCSHGEAVLQSCPPGLYFNPNGDYCDWPENVDCQN